MAEATNRPGFLAYKDKHLPKVNSMRMAASLVQITAAPTLEKGQVLFSSSANAHGEPRSCYNCPMYNATAETCKYLGPAIRVKKFVYPPSGGKAIEYWPACGAWNYGVPNVGPANYKAQPFDEPDELGFGWINAPEIGLAQGGASCGGQGNGDDCDNYIIAGEDKRLAPVGYCRVLRMDVENGACCTAWGDDDWLPWQKGQDLLKDLDKQTVSASPNPLLPR